MFPLLQLFLSIYKEKYFYAISFNRFNPLLNRTNPLTIPIYNLPGYGKGLAEKFLAVNDLQRIDMGIAMCHWALTAQEAGLHGEWAKVDPGIALADG